MVSWLFILYIFPKSKNYLKKKNIIKNLLFSKPQINDFKLDSSLF